MIVKRTVGLSLTLIMLAGFPALAKPTAADIRRQAEALSTANMSDAATDLLFQGTLLYPKDAALFFALGQAKERAGDDWAARDAYGDALKVEPKHAPSLIALAVLKAKDGNDEALPLLRQAQKLAPNDGRVLTALGRALAQDKPTEAQTLLERAIKLDPRNADARVVQADVAGGQGNIDLFRKQLRAALDVQPDHIQALMMLGNDLVDSGVDKNQGLALLRRAFDLKPKQSGLAQTLLDRLRFAEQWQDMETVARKWAAVSEDDAQSARRYLVMSLEGQGKLTQAVAVLAELQKQTGDATDILSWRAQVEHKLGHWGNAEAFYQKALAQSGGGDTDMMLAYGKALEAHDRLADAITQYRAMVKAEPGAGRHALKLAAALIRAGQKAEAKQVLQQAAKNDPDDEDVAQALKAL
jgi:tetratricopeptide (TPR) repeat protein